MAEHDVRVCVAGTEHVGTLEQRTGLVITVSFERPSAPRIPIATQADLIVAGARSAKTQFPARTISCQEQESRRVYDFLVAREHQSELDLLLIKRDSVRIRVASGVAVLVEADQVAHPVQGVLHDLSVSGAGILIQMDDEELLYAASRVTTRFSLPGEPLPFELFGLIRNRQLVGSTICYGVQFERDADKPYDQEENRLFRFVRRQEIEALRRARGLSR